METLEEITARMSDAVRAYGAAAGEAIGETLWPTRCAVCDEPGEVLCATCRLTLPYLDWWRACHRCGAPVGHVQCTECNPIVMAARQRDEPPFTGCASATTFDERTGRIVRTWKDGGERRLSAVMAGIMARVVPPQWKTLQPTIVPVPASAAAVRRRGFDHGAELASTLAQELDLPSVQLLAAPHTHDQRKLTREDRLRNLQGRFRVLPGADAPRTAVLVDDVFTTGSTLYAATDALLAAGSNEVYCLTFARVW